MGQASGRQEADPPESTSLRGLENHGVHLMQVPDLFPSPKLSTPPNGAEWTSGRKLSASLAQAPGWVRTGWNVGVSAILGIHIKQNHFSTTGRSESHTDKSPHFPTLLLELCVPCSPTHLRDQCTLFASGAQLWPERPSCPLAL